MHGLIEGTRQPHQQVADVYFFRRIEELQCIPINDEITLRFEILSKPVKLGRLARPAKSREELNALSRAELDALRQKRHRVFAAGRAVDGFIQGVPRFQRLVFQALHQALQEDDVLVAQWHRSVVNLICQAIKPDNCPSGKEAVGREQSSTPASQPMLVRVPFPDASVPGRDAFGSCHGAGAGRGVFFNDENARSQRGRGLAQALLGR